MITMKSFSGRTAIQYRANILSIDGAVYRLHDGMWHYIDHHTDLPYDITDRMLLALVQAYDKKNYNLEKCEIVISDQELRDFANKTAA